jgi:hypothetical protein
MVSFKKLFGFFDQLVDVVPSALKVHQKLDGKRAHITLAINLCNYALVKFNHHWCRLTTQSQTH